MNLYKISQSRNNNWDTYDSAVVVAETSEEARKIVPDFENDGHGEYDSLRDWVEPKYVKVELIGTASDEYVEKLQGRLIVVSSYNAG